MPLLCAQLAAGRAELKRATDEHTRGQQESKQSLEALHGVCRELRSKCASTLDELDPEELQNVLSCLGQLKKKAAPVDTPAVHS